jgi:hypothetical protein
MVDLHSRSFFGQHTGIIVKSPSKQDDFIFFTCLRKKKDGVWEKPSQGEGKTIKFSLEEMALILQVLSKESDAWTTYHSFKEEKTVINFKWDNSKKEQIYITIEDYKKSLQTSQIIIFRMLMEHMLVEKIEFATGSILKLSDSGNGKISKEEYPDNLVIKEEIIEVPEKHQKVKKNVKTSDKKKSINNKTTWIKGSIMGSSDKALLIMFENNLEVWLPRSTIHSDYKIENKGIQEFSIDAWILKKNNIFF